MERKWWHGRTAYQIYPKSFKDTNGDGIGDIRGIIEKLDYLQELGIGILWISPVYVSPAADQGYDIADYYEIDPKFGTMADMDELLEEAKKRDIKILMDLVVNHCSDEHEWFKKAKADPDGEYGKYFYIEESKDGKLPTNWRSYFGGPVWERIEGTDKYYLHIFHKKQPDLNWENPVVREKIYEMVNWWLDKGVAGFRIDAIINIKKPFPLCDYPADREDGLCAISVPLAHAKGIGEFLGELKERTFAKYDALTVGEVFHVTDKQLEEFIGDNGYFSTMFDFRQHLEGRNRQGWFACRIPTPEDYKRCCFESQKISEGIGYLANIIENHDEPRGVSRYLPKDAQNETGKKLLATMYFMMKGIPFIYQGQEIGMENNDFNSMDEIDDPRTHSEYKRCLENGYDAAEAQRIVNAFSRDNGRTPFQWSDEEHAGFTTGKPWLVVNQNYKKINAAEQQKREDSVLSYYKKLCALRKHPAYAETIVYGETRPILVEEKDIMAYLRCGEKQTILVIGNFDSETRTVNAAEMVENAVVLLNNCADYQLDKNSITLKPYQALVLVLPTA